MATKKIEEKGKKVVKKSSSKKNSTNSKKVNNELKKSTIEKKVQKEEVSKEEKMIICENCGKEYLASLEECPHCAKKEKKYLDEDDFEEYDDEEYVEENIKEKKIVVEEEKEVEEDKKEKKKTPVKTKKKEKFKRDKRNSVVGGTFKEQNADLFRLIKIIVAVIILVGVVYLAIAYLNGEFKQEEKNDEPITAEIQNEKILASSIFNKKDKDYYVFAYASEEVESEYYNTLFTDYTSLNAENVVPLFWVDLDDRLNADVLVKEDEKTNKKANKVSDLRMKSPTLIHIKKGKNVDYWEGDKAIEKLRDLLKSYRDSE